MCFMFNQCVHGAAQFAPRTISFSHSNLDSVISKNHNQQLHVTHSQHVADSTKERRSLEITTMRYHVQPHEQMKMTWLTFQKHNYDGFMWAFPLFSTLPEIRSRPDSVPHWTRNFNTLVVRRVELVDGLFKSSVAFLLGQFWVWRAILKNVPSRM